MPRILFQLAKKPNEGLMKSILEKFEKLGISKVEVGRGTPSFILDRYNHDIIERVLPPISQERGPVLEGVTQLIAMKRMMPVYRAINAFLATHTYEYKGHDGSESTRTSRKRVGERIEMRNRTNWYREGWNKEKEQKIGTDEMEVDGEVDALEKKDLTPDMPTQCNADQIVVVAKPSPLPSSTNFGKPSEVPNKKGLLFPYFDGMLISDTKAFRSLVCDLFFRNLASPGQETREAYTLFRAECGSFASTAAGREMTHILQGIKLGLEAQAIVYLLFDEGTYKGFCLLGEYYQVFMNGHVYSPLSEEELRAELLTLQTKSESRASLKQALRECKDVEGNLLQVGDEEDFSKVLVVARILSKVGIEASGKELVRDVEEKLARCGFPTQYRTFKPSFVAEAVRLLCDASVPLPDDLIFFIPPSNWRGIDEREYQILASFGPRSFSFRNARGVEFTVPRDTKDEDRLSMDAKKEGAQTFMLVSEKKVTECVRDWAELKKTGKIRMDLDERAGGNRGLKFEGKSKDLIWNELKNAGIKGVFERGTDEGKKRTHDAAFGTDDALADFSLDFL
jgi:hypothetical protein